MGHSPGKDRTPGGGKEYYETCPDFYQLCEYEFRCKLDAAAAEHNAKCKAFLDKKFNAVGPEVQWAKLANSIWLNPPYSRGMVPLFFQKSYEASQQGATVVCLVHTCTDVKYWDDWVWDKAAEVRHIHGRLKFWLPHPDKKGNYGTVSDLPHSLIVYRPYYLGRTHQSIWKWKEDYLKRFGRFPMRDLRSPDKTIKYYLNAEGLREAA